MSKATIITMIVIIAIELATAVFLGWLVSSFFGNLSAHIGSKPFKRDFVVAKGGFLMGLFIFGPAINAIEFFFRRQYRIAFISFILAATVFVLHCLVIPRIQKIRQAKADAAPAIEIAKRAIDGTNKKEYDDSVVFTLMVGHHLSLYEGNDTRLSEEKEKEVAECAAQLLTEDTTLSPGYTGFSWKTVYQNGEIYYYVLNLCCDDGHYVNFYHMDKKRWESLGLDTPPEIESISLNLQYNE